MAQVDTSLEQDENRNTNRENRFSRCRNYCLTINNFDTHDVEFLKSLDCRNCVFQSEMGNSGTEHLQIVIGFRNARSFSSIKKMFPRAHIEKCRNLQASCNYCSKNDTWTGHIRYDKRNGRVIKDDMNESPTDPTHQSKTTSLWGPYSNPSPEWLTKVADDFKEWYFEKLKKSYPTASREPCSARARLPSP